MEKHDHILSVEKKTDNRFLNMYDLQYENKVGGQGIYHIASRGASIGHVSPEAASGGEIGLVQEGDIISIDIPNSKVNVNVSDEELEARRAKYVPREPNVKSGWLYRYSRLVTSADQGAVVR